jgi:hypothetical protein
MLIHNTAWLDIVSRSVFDIWEGGLTSATTDPQGHLMRIQGLTGGMVRGSRLRSCALRIKRAVSQGLQNKTTSISQGGVMDFPPLRCS